MLGGGFSFLLLIVFSYILVKKGFDKQVFEGFPKFLFSICYPALVLVSFTGENSLLSPENIPLIILLALISTLSFFALGCIALRRYQKEARRPPILFYMIANNTFLAFPFIYYFFGAFGLSFIILFGMIQDFLIWSLGYMQYSKSGDLKQTIKSTLNPCFIAVIIGMFFTVNGWGLPDFLATPIQMLADVSLPVVLLLVGSLIAQNTDALKFIDRDAVLTILARMLLFPLLTFGILHLIGIDLTIVLLASFIVSLPAPMLGIVLARQFDKDIAFASTLFMLSTLLFLLNTAVLFLLQTQGIIPGF